MVCRRQLTVLSAALAFTFPCVGAASATQAELFSFPSRQVDGANFSPAEARLWLANTIDTLKYYSSHEISRMKDVMKDITEKYTDKFSATKNIFGHEDSSNALVVVAGVDDIKDFVSSTTPSASLKDCPGSSKFKDLIQDLVHEKSSAVGRPHRAVYSSAQTVFHSIPKEEDLESQVSVLFQESERLEAAFETEFGVSSAEDFDFSRSIDANFARDILNLKAFVETMATEGETHLSSIFFASLEALGNAYGTSSKIYKSGLDKVKHVIQDEVISQASDYNRVTVIVVPFGVRSNSLDFKKNVLYESGHNKRKHQISKRSSSPITISGVGDYPSEFDCLEATNACSGHGACAENTLKGTWSCVCKASIDSGKTTYWAGPACQKRDISVPFHLFFWTGLLIVVAIAASTSLLFSMGNENLPGVLIAATVMHSKNNS